MDKTWNVENRKLEEFWYENGQIMKRGIRQHDQMEGECKWWYENGQLSVRQFYKSGIEDGNRREWYSNGRIMVWAFNQDGKYEGEGKSWYKNGKIWEHKFFRSGVCIDDNFTFEKKNSLIKIKNRLKLRALDIHSSLSDFLIDDLFSLFDL